MYLYILSHVYMCVVVDARIHLQLWRQSPAPSRTRPSVPAIMLEWGDNALMMPVVAPLPINTPYKWYPHVSVALEVVEAEPSSFQNAFLLVGCWHGMTRSSYCRWPPRCLGLLPRQGSSGNRRNRQRELSWNRGLNWKCH